MRKQRPTMSLCTCGSTDRSFSCTDLCDMGEERREGLSQLSSMLQLYIQQEVPNITQELPAVDPLSLLAKVDHCNCVCVCVCVWLACMRDRQTQNDVLSQ